MLWKHFKNQVNFLPFDDLLPFLMRRIYLTFNMYNGVILLRFGALSLIYEMVVLVGWL